MPLFPDENIASDEERWLFLSLQPRKDGGIEFDVIKALSTTLEEDAYTTYQEKPGAILRNTTPIRIRRCSGGGRYIDVHIALWLLLKAGTEEHLWSARAPIQNGNDGDLYVYPVIAPAHENKKPHIIDAFALEGRPKTKAAVTALHAAIKESAPAALKQWAHYPADFALRQQAEEELTALLRPAQKKGCPHRKASL